MNPREMAEAIQEDVNAEDNLPTLTSPDSPRMRALDAIGEAHRKRMEAELGLGLEAEDDTPPGDQVKEQLAEPAPTESEPAPAAPEPVKVKVKIDGAEEEVDLDTLTRTYQKNKAADRRLEEAAQILRAAQQAAVAAPEPAPQPTPVETPEDLKAQAAELLDKLYDGDKDSASEALVKLLAQTRGGQAPTPPVQAVVDPEVLTSKVLERMQTLSAFERVKTDYPEIIANPDLELLAATKVERLVATGTPRADALLTAADEVYQLIGKKGRQETPPEPSRSKRQENKERLDPVPAASAAAVSPQSPAESSPSAVIAELASRRLGQTLPR